MLAFLRTKEVERIVMGTYLREQAQNSVAKLVRRARGGSYLFSSQLKHGGAGSRDMYILMSCVFPRSKFARLLLLARLWVVLTALDLLDRTSHIALN